MDRQRHRLLTENVSYFQKCLTVTRELLKTCVDEGVLREEEEQTIWVRTRKPLRQRPTARIPIYPSVGLPNGGGKVNKFDQVHMVGVAVIHA